VVVVDVVGIVDAEVVDADVVGDEVEEVDVVETEVGELVVVVDVVAAADDEYSSTLPWAQSDTQRLPLGSNASP